MSEYYGVSTPTSDFLAHYGVRGMKWGVRKAVERTGAGRPRSKAYMDAEKKLKRATMAGGLIGGLGHVATHRYEVRSINQKREGQVSKRNNAQTRTKASSRQLREQAMAAGKKREEAYNNLSRLGKAGFGKTAKAYREANQASKEATSKYYNSLSKKQYARLRRNHRG